MWRNRTKQGLKAMSFIATLTCALAANAMSVIPGGQLLFKSDSDAVVLESGMRAHVTQALESIASSCQYPQASRQDWKEKIFSPYGFHVTYDQPHDLTFHTYKGGTAGEVWKVTDIFLPLDDDPVATGIYVRTADKKWSYLFKCDGAQMIDLVCTPTLQAHMPGEGGLYQVSCANRTPRDIRQENANLTPAETAPDTAPAAGEAVGAARLLVPEALEKAISDSITETKETRSVEDPSAGNPVVSEKDLPFFTPEAGAAFEIQDDEMILQ